MLALCRLANAVFAAYAQGDLTEKMGASTRRITLVAICGIAAAIGTLAAIGCAIFALWVFALPHLGPVGAPLLTAGALIVLSIVPLVAMRVASRRPPPRARPSIAPELILAEATRVFKENKLAVLLAVVVAGLVAGSDGRRR